MTAKNSYLRYVSNNFIAVHKAAERISRFYDAQLAPSGLRNAQFAMLVLINELEEVGVNGIAENLALDRLTASKNLRALEEAGLIRIAASAHDGRRRTVTITPEGCIALKAAVPLWRGAQRHFEELNGATHAAFMRTTLKSLIWES